MIPVEVRLKVPISMKFNNKTYQLVAVLVRIGHNINTGHYYGYYLI